MVKSFDNNKVRRILKHCYFFMQRQQISDVLVMKVMELFCRLGPWKRGPCNDVPEGFGRCAVVVVGRFRDWPGLDEFEGVVECLVEAP